MSLLESLEKRIERLEKFVILAIATNVPQMIKILLEFLQTL